MPLVLINNEAGTLHTAVDAAATTLDVNGTGLALATGDHAYYTLADSAGVEIVRVTAVAAGGSGVDQRFTVVRGQDGTTARSWSANAAIEARLCKAALEDLTGAGPPDDLMYMAAGTDTAFSEAEFLAGTSASGTEIVAPVWTVDSYLAFAVPNSRGEPTDIRQPPGATFNQRNVFTRNSGTLDIGGEPHIVLVSNSQWFAVVSGTTWGVV